MTELRLPGARVLFSDRNGGVSEGPYRSLNLGVLTEDDPANVAENRRRLAARLGIEPGTGGHGLAGARRGRWPSGMRRRRIPATRGPAPSSSGWTDM